MTNGYCVGISGDVRYKGRALWFKKDCLESVNIKLACWVRRFIKPIEPSEVSCEELSAEMLFRC